MKLERNNTHQNGKTVKLDHYIADFNDLIVAQGYAQNTAEMYHRSAKSLCKIMIAKRLNFADLNDDVSNKIITNISCAASVKAQKHCRYRMERFRDYLIEHTDAPARAEPAIDMSPRACLKREYEVYLKEQRGLADSTICDCLRCYDRFLTFKFGDDLGDLNAVKPDDVTDFLLKVREKQNAPRDKSAPSHLRNLFKFWFWNGRTKRNLSKVVPSRRQPKPTNIPRYLSPEAVNRLIEAARDQKRNGRRNYAMLLLIARLGLRAPEVTTIELEDINWRAGEILIRGKGQLHDRMPLPAEVGEAIVDYIRNERRGEDRVLFVSGKAPFKRFKDVEILRWILRKTYDATGINPPQSYIGSHILRHSLATDMLRKGASLDEISDVLRHRSPMATTIYAQHDVDALRTISRAWPMSGENQ